MWKQKEALKVSFLSNITIDLHLVLVLRQYIFVLVMEKLTTNDIVLVNKTRQVVNIKLEIWKDALESKD